MKFSIGRLALLVVCAFGCRGNAKEDHLTRLSRCGDAAAMTHAELLDGAPRLCEHQTLVASLRPDARVVVPFQLVRDETIEYCFEDDDYEPHTAELIRDGVAHLELTAGRKCVTERLEPGEYELRVRHARHGEHDLSPDVLHTRWLPSDARADGEPSRFLLSVNACPGCDLRGKDFPSLGAGEAGYTGNYDGADFSGARCSADVPDRVARTACMIGTYGPSSFANAKFDRVTFGPPKFGIIQFGRDGETSFRGASFVDISFPDGPGWTHSEGPGVLKGDFTEADLRVSAYHGVFGEITFKNTKFPTTPEHSASNVFWGSMFKSYVVGDLAAYREIISNWTSPTWTSFTLKLAPGDDLEDLIVNPLGNLIIDWAVGPDGRFLSRAGMSFRRSELLDVDFQCENGHDLSGARFDAAGLNGVNLADCNLTGAVFDGADIEGVVATHAAFTDVSMRDVEVRGLDLSQGKLSGVVQAKRVHEGALIAEGAIVSVSADGLVAPGARFFHADLSGARLSNAQLPRADFGGARLDGTDFTGAHLEGATFSGATGTGTIFRSALLSGSATVLDGARLTDANFDSARLDGATLRNARVCGGSANGVTLNGADLSNTLMPAEGNTFTIDGDSFVCHAVAARETATTNAATHCPNLEHGPCTTEEAWTPVGVAATCCHPFQDPECHRLASGQPCTSGCDCVALQCIGGVCP